jgi:hypothetical protein
MKIETTYRELNQRASEIAHFKNQWPTMALMLGSRIGEFDKRNAICLDLMKKCVRALMEQHIAKTEDGTRFETTKEEGKPETWKFLSDESKTAFEEGYKEIMEKPCTVYV